MMGMSDLPWRGLGVAGPPLSCSRWMWAAETRGRDWVQSCSRETFSDEQTHASPVKQENKCGVRTKWDREGR